MKRAWTWGRLVYVPVLGLLVVAFRSVLLDEAMRPAMKSVVILMLLLLTADVFGKLRGRE